MVDDDEYVDVVGGINDKIMQEWKTKQPRECISGYGGRTCISWMYYILLQRGASHCTSLQVTK